MGADLISAIAVWPKDSKLDFDAGEEAAKNLTLADGDGYIFDDVLFLSEGEDSPELQAEFRERMLACVDNVRNLIEGHSRNTVTYTLFGHNVLFLGDMSWGDTPEGYDDLIAVIEVTPVREAIGFSLEY